MAQNEENAIWPFRSLLFVESVVCPPRAHAQLLSLDAVCGIVFSHFPVTVDDNLLPAFCAYAVQ